MFRKWNFVAAAVAAGLLCAAAAHGSGTGEHHDIRSGFLRAGLDVSKAFDAPGDWTVRDSLGVGTQNPLRAVHLVGRRSVFRMDRDVNSASLLLVRTARNDFSTVEQAWLVGGRDDSFLISDLGTSTAGGGDRRVTIDLDGNFGINTSNPLAALHVQGTGSPLLLGLRDGAEARLVVDAAGTVRLSDDLLFYRGTATPEGFAPPWLAGEASSIVADVSGAADGAESWLVLNRQNALVGSPGNNDSGLLSIFDQDRLGGLDTTPLYTFMNDVLELRGGGAGKSVNASGLGPTEPFVLRTTGVQMRHVVDENGDTQPGFVSYAWLDGRFSTVPNFLMTLDPIVLSLKGALQENVAFDLAEGFWKSDESIEAGDVVRIDPSSASAVTRTARAADPAVVGVVSTKPGIIMGGGAFTAEELAEVWGGEVAEVFASERAELEAVAFQRFEGLRHLADGLYSFDVFLARQPAAGATKSGLEPEDRERHEAAYRQELVRLAQTLEHNALKVFFERHVARVALAGRVPVKVDAAYGAIRPGDLLVSSPTPGHAMRGADPGLGTVLGKALESLDSGTGKVLMLVMMR